MNKYHEGLVSEEIALDKYNLKSLAANTASKVSSNTHEEELLKRQYEKILGFSREFLEEFGEDGDDEFFIIGFRDSLFCTTPSRKWDVMQLALGGLARRDVRALNAISKLLGFCCSNCMIVELGDQLGELTEWSRRVNRILDILENGDIEAAKGHVQAGFLEPPNTELDDMSGAFEVEKRRIAFKLALVDTAIELDDVESTKTMVPIIRKHIEAGPQK